jgi:hypothetical protein
MAYLTLAELRARLNLELGTTDGSTEPWGDRDVRNAAVVHGFERLEPGVMRLLQESFPAQDDQLEYDLDSGIREVQLIEVTDSAGNVKDIKNYRAWLVSGVGTRAMTCRIRLARPLSADLTLTVTGHAPYETELSESVACDMETRYVWIPLTWARAELYRRRFHAWLDFERYNAENPSTAIDPGVLFQAYQDSARLFEQAKAEHAKSVSIPRRARLAR